MSYTVRWRKKAWNDLADIWLNASDQAAVTAASAAIESRLKRDPLRVGRAVRSSVHRGYSVPPLGVLFEVIEDDKRVIVLAVFRVA